MDNQKKRLIILGASGHGKVILDIALQNGYEVLGFLDDDRNRKECAGYPVLGEIKDVPLYTESTSLYRLKEENEEENGFSKKDKGIEFIIGIGSNQIRKKLSYQYDLPWATLIHPKAVIGRQVQIGRGTVIMANAVINPCAVIGAHCIINTGCIIEHDNQLGDYVHISPGAVLAGTVTVGNESHIGANAAVKNNITISSQTVIGIGAAVVKDIRQPGIYAGVPAGKIR